MYLFSDVKASVLIDSPPFPPKRFSHSGLLLGLILAHQKSLSVATETGIVEPVIPSKITSLV